LGKLEGVYIPTDPDIFKIEDYTELIEGIKAGEQDGWMISTHQKVIAEQG